ncbi:MAG: N-acetylmuramic acid 6-phosphate etherase [Bacteroidia bacterium]
MVEFCGAQKALNTMQTESRSQHRHLESMNFLELVDGINQEDARLAAIVQAELPAIARLAEAIFERLLIGGRLFYMGAGTSGRLGVVDASECPPTFGVPFDKVIGIMAGGDGAIRKAVEFAEDDTEQGWKDLEAWNISAQDLVVGISASGRTPYVLAALQACKAQGIQTGCIVCNPDSAIAQVSNFPVAVVTGPEFVTGSTRMKAGTATKMVLNMLTTSVMIKLGHVQDNKMVDMQLTNHKLIERGTRMVQEETGLSDQEAKVLLLAEGSVRKAVDAFRRSK